MYDNVYTLGGAGTEILLFRANGSGLTVGYNDVHRNDHGLTENKPGLCKKATVTP